MSLMKAAKNIDQVYEFLNYMHSPEVSAAVAEGSGYNPVVTGADALLSDAAKKNFQEAFPGDALKNLWPWPAEPTWYARNPQPVRRQVQGRLSRRISSSRASDNPAPDHLRGWFVLRIPVGFYLNCRAVQ